MIDAFCDKARRCLRIILNLYIFNLSCFQFVEQKYNCKTNYKAVFRETYFTYRYFLVNGADEEKFGERQAEKSSFKQRRC